jgi:hypothetical protein
MTETLKQCHTNKTRKIQPFLRSIFVLSSERILVAEILVFTSSIK